MINIHPYVNGSSVITLWDTSYGPVPLKAVCLRDLSCAKEQKVGLRPVTTSKSRLENRSCTHDNWTGDVLWSPDTLVSKETLHTSITTKYIESVAYTQYTLTPDADNPTSVINCAVWILPGSGGTLVLPPTRMYYRGYYSLKCTIEWEWQGNVLTTKKLYWSQKDGKVPVWNQNIFRFEFADGVTLPLNWAKVYYGARNVTGYSKPSDWIVPTFLMKGSLSASSTSNHVETEKKFELTKSDLRLASRWMRGYVPPTDINMWGDLCQEAIHDAQSVDINSLQFVRELFEMKDSLLSTVKLLRGKISAKSLAKLFLGLRYGLNLTVKDTEELNRAIANTLDLDYRKWYRYCRSMDYRASSINSGLLRNIAVDQYFFYKIYYDPVDTGFRSLIRKLLDWDAFPTFQNLWDFIPFSFVLDWFVDFENYFDIVDTGGYAMYLKVLEVIETRKTTFHSVPLEDFLPLSREGWTMSGEIEYTLYERKVRPYLTLPRLRLDTPQNFRNYAELTAIIVSNLK